MAYDNNQLVMHKLQVKASRCEDGLRKFVTAYVEGNLKQVTEAYWYALGCLGGEDLKKTLFKSPHFEKVVNELKEKKFMKTDVADKNIEAWKASEYAKTENAEQYKEQEFHEIDIEVAEPNKVSDKVIEQPPIPPETSAEVKGEVEPIAPSVAPKADDEVDENTHKVVTVFGEYDEYGNLIPKQKKVIADCVAPAPTTNKFNSPSSDSSGGGKVKMFY